jgi:hypothetical protein
LPPPDLERDLLPPVGAPTSPADQSETTEAAPETPTENDTVAVASNTDLTDAATDNPADLDETATTNAESNLTEPAPDATAATSATTAATAAADGTPSRGNESQVVEPEAIAPGGRDLLPRPDLERDLLPPVGAPTGPPEPAEVAHEEQPEWWLAPAAGTPAATASGDPSGLATSAPVEATSGAGAEELAPAGATSTPAEATSGAGAEELAPGAGAAAGAAAGGSGRRKVVVGGLVAAAVVVVAAVVVLRRGGEGEVVLTFDGQAVDGADETLAGAETSLQAIVDQRHGATGDETRCYFSLPDGGSTDVNPYLRCGPVLFVDGDPEQAYLTFPLQPAPDAEASDDAAVRLVAAEQPQSPEPTGLDEGERLRRPDGQDAPDDAGGLEAPAPPRAEPGLVQAISLDGIELSDPGDDAVIGSWSRSYRLLGTAGPARFGSGDDARRPAEGERFVAVQIQVSNGEATAEPVPAAPQLAIQVGDADPIPVPDQLAAGTVGETLGLVASVPEDAADADQVDLVVTDLGVEQRISLTTGEPDPANVQVLRRDTRAQQLDAQADLTFTASAPGRVPESFTVQVGVPQVGLYWFFGSDGSQHPADPDRAYLVPDTRFTWDPDLNLGPDTSLEAPAFTLELPDGTVIPATNLAAEGQVLVVFDVPADFTTGTLVIGGSYSGGDGVTVDFGTSAMRTPIEIPAG